MSPCSSPVLVYSCVGISKLMRFATMVPKERDTPASKCALRNAVAAADWELSRAEGGRPSLCYNWLSALLRVRDCTVCPDGLVESVGADR